MLAGGRVIVGLGIDISEIAIPLKEFDNGRLPSAVDVKAMVGEASKCLAGLRSKTAVEQVT